jgi:hypothetical protein
VTFDEAAEAYLQKYEDGWKNPVHRWQWCTTLRDHISPVLGKLDVMAIDTEAVLRVLEPIWSSRHETASRIRGRIETVLDFAGRNGSNPARWKGQRAALPTAFQLFATPIISVSSLRPAASSWLVAPREAW